MAGKWQKIKVQKVESNPQLILIWKILVIKIYPIYHTSLNFFLKLVLYSHPTKELDHRFTQIVDFVDQQWGHVIRPLYEIEYAQ